MRTTEPFRRIENAGHGKTCPLCGKAGLVTGVMMGRFVLINEIGTEHKCDPVMQRKHLAADFDEVSE